ncbi:hypothetical protein DIPPA_15361 [Diplonema papillatum]|nr:hypothetical protein DIPPA_15361 [Diplonema papillatum]
MPGKKKKEKAAEAAAAESKADPPAEQEEKKDDKKAAKKGAKKAGGGKKPSALKVKSDDEPQEGGSPAADEAGGKKKGKSKKKKDEPPQATPSPAAAAETPEQKGSDDLKPSPKKKKKKKPSSPAALSPLPPDFRNRVVRWYVHNDKQDKLAHLDELLRSWHDATDALVKKMQTAYGPEPETPEASYRDRISAFLQRHDPEKAAHLDDDLAGREGDEELFYNELKLRYGGDPLLTYRGVPPSPKAGGSDAGKSAQPSLASPVRSPVERGPGWRSGGSVAFSDNAGSGGGGDDEAPLPPQQAADGYRWKVGDFVSCRFPPVSGPERRGVVVEVNNGIGKCTVLWRDGAKTHRMDTILLEHTDEWSVPQLAESDAIEERLRELAQRERDIINEQQQLAMRDGDLHAFARYVGAVDAPAAQSPARWASPVAGGTPYPGGVGSPLPPPPAPASEYKDRLTALYCKYNPAQLLLVDDMLAAARGREEKMFAALVRTHGPEPSTAERHQLLAGKARRQNPTPAGQKDRSVPPPLRPIADGSLRGRLDAFYASVDSPKHPRDVSNVASQYAAREPELWTALSSKYGAIPPEYTTGSDKPHPFFYDDRPSPRGGGAGGGAELSFYGRSPRQGRRPVPSRRAHQAQVLRAVRRGAEDAVLLVYYFRWLELVWWRRSRAAVEAAARRERLALAKKRYEQQQLSEQVAVLKHELTQQQQQQQQQARPPHHHQQPQHPFVHRQKAPDVLTPRDATYPAPHPFQKWAAPAAPPQPAPRLDGEAAAETERLAAERYERRQPSERSEARAGAAAAPNGAIPPEYTTGSDKPHPFFYDDRPSPRGGGSGDGAELSFYGRSPRQGRRPVPSRRAHQAQVLRAVRRGAEDAVLLVYYFRWLELVWWRRSRAAVEAAARRERLALAKKRYEQQQLSEQVAVLKHELTQQQQQQQQQARPPHHHQQPQHPFVHRQKAPDVLTPRDATYPAPHPFQKWAAPAAPPQPAPRLDGEAAAETERLAAEVQFLRQQLAARQERSLRRKQRSGLAPGPRLVDASTLSTAPTGRSTRATTRMAPPSTPKSGSDKPHPFFYDDRPSPRGGGSGDGAELSFYGRSPRQGRRPVPSRRAHQAQVLRAVRRGAEDAVLLVYYFRWLELVWWRRSRAAVEAAARRERLALAKKRYEQQQLSEQVAVLKHELTQQQQQQQQQARPPHHHQQPQHPFVHRQKAPDVLTPRDATYPAPHPFQKWAAPAAPPQPAPRLDGEAAAETERLAAERYERRQPSERSEARAGAAAAPNGAIPPEYTTGSDKPHPFFYDDRPSPRGGGSGDGAELSFYGRSPRQGRRPVPSRRAHQAQVLRAVRRGAEDAVLLVYYFRWLELVWWRRSRAAVEAAARRERLALAKKRYEQQQLSEQVAVLKHELTQQQQQQQQQARPPHHHQQPQHPFVHRQKAPDVLTPRDATYPAPHPFQKWAAPAAPPQPAPRLDGEAAAETERLAAEVQFLRQQPPGAFLAPETEERVLRTTCRWAFRS